MPLPSSNREIDFGIEIKFDRHSPDPSRIFRAISGLIDSFQRLDHTLIAAIDASIQPVLMLEDIEAGSIKTWLRYVLTSVDDDALKSGDAKKVIGNFLVRGKYSVLRFLSEKNEPLTREGVESLQREIARAAAETDIKRMPFYGTVSLPELLGNIRSVGDAMGQLSENDVAEFITTDGDTEISPSLQLTVSHVEELITRETLDSESQMILRVKKPDYLGESKWEFVLDHAIEAKILDEEWLSRFQSRLEDVRPGDALRATVRTRISYGYESEVLSIKYEILRVIQIIRFNPPSSPMLLPE